MQLLPILRRAVVSLSILTLLAFATLLAVIHGGQHLLRHRAERLNAELIAFRIHPGTFADIQRMQREWGRFAYYDGVCTREHCIYDITLGDPFSELLFYADGPKTPWAGKLYPHVARPLQLLGYHGSWLRAELRVHDDRMWGEDLMLTPESAGPAMILHIQSGPRLFSRGGNFTATALRRGYDVSQPGACTGCIDLRIFVNPNATPRDIERLTRVNMACLGRWRGCEAIADFVPDAAREDERRRRMSESERDANWHDCSVPIDRMALEAANAVMVEAVGSPALERLVGSSPSDPKVFRYHLRAVERLKNARPVQLGKIYEVADYGEYPDRPPTPLFLPGGRYIFFFPEPSQLEPPDAMSLMGCSVFPATEKSLQAVKNGAAKDFSGDEPYRPLGW